MRTFIALILLFSAAGLAAAPAQRASALKHLLIAVEMVGEGLIDEKTAIAALANIEKIRCADDKACAPATDAEKKNPPPTLSEPSQVFGRGILSGGAAYCEMDWNKRNYLPMMAHWREQLKKNDRQLALVSLVHDIAKDQLIAEFWGKGKCPDEMKKDIESKLNFKP